MPTCKTVSVIYTSNPSGGLVDINEADFDPALHILPDAVEKPKRGRPSKQVTEADNGDR
jgi:hypothetical protein